MLPKAQARFPNLLCTTVAATAAVALAFAWRPAAAQGTAPDLRPRVFTGEHGGFSRVVVQVPRGTGARLEQEACGARIVLSRPGDWPTGELNGDWLQRVWNFRPAEEGRALSFDWACGSSAKSWRERDMLIVDVGTVPMPGRKPGSPVPPDPQAVLVAGTVGEEEMVPAEPPAPFGLVSSAQAQTFAPQTFPPQPAEQAVEEEATASAEPAAPAPPDPIGVPMSLVPESSEAVRPEPPIPPAPAVAAVATPAAASAAEISPLSADEDFEAAVRDGVQKALAALEAERAAVPSAPPSAPPSAEVSEAPPSPTAEPAPAPPVPVAAPAADPDEPHAIGMMDVSAWAQGDRAARIADLTQAAGTAEGEARVEALLELARLHLAHSMPEEGLAAIEAAGDEGSPGLRRSLRIAGDALRVLRGDADPAASVFVRLDPPASADHRLWRAAALAGPGAGTEGWRKARLDLPEALRRLLAYPGDLRAYLLTRLADGAAAQGDAESLDRIVLEMLTMDAGFAQDRRLDFYRGLVAELRSDAPGALARYDAASEVAGPFARRAQLRAVELRRRGGELDEAGAVEALERLRFAWRGDEVEASTLEALGHAYLRAGRTDLVLEMLDRIGRRFTGTPHGREAAASARTLISSLIGRPDPDTAAQALFLNRRHGDLIAVIDEDGSLRRRLAARLAQEGLSLEAGRLLAALAEDGPEAGRAAAALDLAELMLRTDRAGDALTVLSETAGSEAGGEASMLRRALLRGEALAVSNRPLEALDALRDLPGAEAARLRARILFAAGEWRGASAAYDALLDLEGAAALQADDVARLGLAAFRAGDLPAVRDAAARYRPVLAGTRWAGLLDILAEDAEPFDPAFLGEDEVVRQLALADGILGLAGRWSNPAGAPPGQ
jgi:cellulose synthase operon protein C